jgi:hypothetical protein
MEPFTQILDPLNSVAVSTLVALIPVAVLLPTQGDTSPEAIVETRNA